jgi:tetratricopeptide (TPR) repeat protein
MYSHFFIRLRAFCLRAMAVLFFFSSCSAPEKEEPAEQGHKVIREAPKDIAEITLKIEKHPESPFLYNDRAKAWIKHKNIEEAVADVNRALALDSTISEVLMTKGDILFMTKKVRDAIAVYESIILNEPKYIDAQMKLAEIYLYIQDYKKSIDYLDNVLRINVHHPKAYFLKGMNFKEAGDTAKAISSFQTTVEQDPEYYDAFMQLGLLFSEKKDPLAVEYFNAASRILPHSTEAFYARAMFHQETGEYDKAIFDYSIIIRMIDPNFKHAHFNTGYIYLLNKKDYKKAAKSFSDAIKCDTAYVEAWYNRGLAFENLKDFKSARENYEKALQINPGYELAEKALKSLK